MMFYRFKYVLHVFLIAVICLTAAPLWAGKNTNAPVIIRDTEIENIFKMWMEPLLEAAGMEQDSINLVLVQSPQINAFVAGGANIFVYTGLIDKTENPGELLGVLAHELGHISGGHLIRTRDAMKRASYESILGMVLGMGAAIVSGQPGAAQAIISGSGNIAQRRFLAHSRVNESTADQAALRYLNASEINPAGLISFFEKLGSGEFISSSRQTEYVRTHPLTHNRITNIKERSESSAYYGHPYPALWVEQHQRMKAKLLGFINPGHVPWVYDDLDRSIAADYARSVAAYRQNEVEKSLAAIDALIKQEPNNPYFQELKGQMLIEFGRVKEAVPYYRRAVKILPKAGLLRIALGHALLESGHGNRERMKEAIKMLERALHEEPRSTRVRRLLATAYGRLGQEILAKLYLAEEALLQRRIPYAKSQALYVQENTKEGSREWIKAKDILTQIENIKK